ncbi:MAG: hypothetical protein ACK5PP_01350, partial [Acidimicrobiales bacterium]
MEAPQADQPGAAPVERRDVLVPGHRAAPRPQDGRPAGDRRDRSGLGDPDDAGHAVDPTVSWAPPAGQVRPGSFAAPPEWAPPVVPEDPAPTG